MLLKWSQKLSDIMPQLYPWLSSQNHVSSMHALGDALSTFEGILDKLGALLGILLGSLDGIRLGL